MDLTTRIEEQIKALRAAGKREARIVATRTDRNQWLARFPMSQFPWSYEEMYDLPYTVDDNATETRVIPEE